MARTTLKLKILTLLSVVTALSLMMSPSCEAANPPTPLLYLDPPTIVGTTVGQEFNVTLMAKDFANLFGWQAGLMWDPAILEGVALYADATLPDDVFDMLAPGVSTLYYPGTFNNVEGTLSYTAQNLRGVNYGVNATAGVSYKFMTVKFRIKALGTSDIHLSDVILIKPQAGIPVQVPVNLLDVFTVHDTYTHAVKILTNSTGEQFTNIFGHRFVLESKALRFNLTSVAARTYATTTTGFCNVTIPRALMWVDDPSEWTVKVNDASPLSQDVAEDTDNYYIYFTYNHIGTLTSPAVLRIEITSKYVIPEFPMPMLLLPLLLTAILIILIFRKLLTSKRVGYVAT